MLSFRRIMSHPTRLHPEIAKSDQFDYFDFPVILVGESEWKGSDNNPVSVLVDPAVGHLGISAADYILSKIDDLMNYCDEVFGVRGLGGSVVIAAVNGASDGTGGAYHYGCGFGTGGGDWYCDVSPDPVEVLGLAMAEISESYMGLQNKGWNCGGSGGESLSRYLAEIVSGGPNGSLKEFSSGPSWDGTDWITRDQGTDQDYSSIGCGTLYLWWMTKKGFTPQQIVQAGEPDGSLSSNYKALTGKPVYTAFTDFKAANPAPGAATSDNPLNAPVPRFPLPPPPPPTPAPGGSLKQKTDYLYAELEQHFAKYPQVLLQLEHQQTQIDAWLKAVP